jgi:hypothetical protein
LGRSGGCLWQGKSFYRLLLSSLQHVQNAATCIYHHAVQLHSMGHFVDSNDGGERTLVTYRCVTNAPCSLWGYDLTSPHAADYRNHCYDNGTDPDSPTGYEAFGNFMLASVAHFKGNHIIWEASRASVVLKIPSWNSCCSVTTSQT